MAKLRIKEAESAARVAFLEHTLIGAFLRDHPDETCAAISWQPQDPCYRIDLYYSGTAPDVEELKAIRSTEGKPMPRIAYCEVDRSTGRCVVHFLEFPKVNGFSPSENPQPG